MSKKTGLLVGLLAVLLIASGCRGNETDQEALERFLGNTERQSHGFTYVEEALGIESVVEGQVEDDLRYRALLTIEDRAVYEHIVSDDALAVKVFDPSRLPGVETAAAFVGNPIAGEALTQGQWVIDYAAAPPLVASVTTDGTLDVGKNPVLDASYIFQYVRRAIDDGREVWKFNREDLQTYNPVYGLGLDPFQQPDEDAGLVRYDVIPPPLPARSQRGTDQALPGTAHFRKMAFFIKGQEIVRIEEIIDFDARREFVLAQRGQGPQYHLRLLENAKNGATRDPVRPRRMSYEIRYGEDISIALPRTDVLVAGLEGIFGPAGLSPLEGLGEEPAVEG